MNRVPLLISLVCALVVPTIGSSCPWHKSMVVFGFWGPTYMASEEELEALFGPTDRTPVPVVEVQGGPAEVGQWSPPQAWPVIAIHAALLPTGEVMHYSLPVGEVGSLAVLWNPATGLFSNVSLDTDIFCSGLSPLPDGQLYVSGGNDYDCPFQGRDITQSFDPVSREWTDLGQMVTGRWYPSSTQLGDGSVLTLSGLDNTCSLAPEMEIYTPGLGLEVIPEGELEGPLYPRLHLLTSGKVAHVGPQQPTLTFDPELPQWSLVAGMAAPGRWDGISFLAPGHPDQIVTCGGSGSNPPTASCERIDLSQPFPLWTPTGSMAFARSHADSLILPNRSVLAIGGGTQGLYGNPVLNPEVYNPDTGLWSILPAHVLGRMYHSTAVLLPDGRVLVAGQTDGPSSYSAEIYSPPYLFNGPRPVVSSAPTAVPYGQDFEIITPDAADIGAVALLAPSTVTHSVNTGQRYVGLGFTTGAGGLTVTGPPNGNQAPPGYYMLFVLNSAGVPSVAEFIRVGQTNVFQDGFESGDTSRWSVTIP